MYNIIPIVIILISLTVLVAILIRKLPNLSSLDVHSIPAAKAKDVKRKILDERLKRKLLSFGKKLQPTFAAVGGKLIYSVKNLRMKLENMRHQIEKSQVPHHAVTVEEKAKKEEFISETLETAQEMAQEDNFEAAEKRFIDVITHDQNNLEAYQGLADLYVENDKLNEAIETLRYVKKLNPNSIPVLIELADLYEKVDNIPKALSLMIQVVEKEPRNPKFLDQVFDLAVKAKHKELAAYYLQQLAEVNPENQKLEDLQKIVDELGGL